MKKLLIVYGTRPEEIKLYPVWKQLKCDALCVNQSKDLHQNMIKPKSTIQERSLRKWLNKSDYKWIIVQGDTRTAFNASLYSFEAGKKIIHIEAGLRSWDLKHPFPEEGYRRMIDSISSIHFFSTEMAMFNVFTPEEVSIAKINPVVGQTGIDTLLEFAPNPKKGSNVIVTIHRNEADMDQIIPALKQIMKDNKRLKFDIYAHPNKQGNRLKKEFKTKKPLPYKKFVNQLANCYAVITDSGGIQEEAPSLNKPVIVVRKNTERLEGVNAGCSIVTGFERDNIVRIANEVLRGGKIYKAMSNVENPYGDGKASERIRDILRQVL